MRREEEREDLRYTDRYKKGGKNRETERVNYGQTSVFVRKARIGEMRNLVLAFEAVSSKSDWLVGWWMGGCCLSIVAGGDA